MISTTPYTKRTSLEKCNFISCDIKIAGERQLNLPVSQKKMFTSQRHRPCYFASSTYFERYFIFTSHTANKNR